MSTKPVACVAAFCDGNRGIGYKGGLPWPSLPGDVENYRRLVTTTQDSTKKNGVIKGRLTWHSASEGDRWVHVVLSRSVSSPPAGCAAVCGDMSAAIQYLAAREDVETVYVLGGHWPYEAAVNDPRCSRMYVTRVMTDFPCDVTMPPFEHLYHRVTDPQVDDRMREDNGVQYRFEMWERNK